MFCESIFDSTNNIIIKVIINFFDNQETLK